MQRSFLDILEKYSGDTFCDGLEVNCEKERCPEF